MASFVCSLRSRSSYLIPLFWLLLNTVAADPRVRNQTTIRIPEADVQTIITFTYQSKYNSINDWFTMLTACLTPLATHVIFGLAKPVFMTQVRAPSFEWLTLANPVSILWRYYAIADRRVRALNWDKLDLAASNTLFWDGCRWNGSEEILFQSRKWIIRTPDYSHTTVISVSGFATIAVTLQGFQAVFGAVSGLLPDGTFGISDGLPGLFLPLAVMGLLRVQAAPWVTGDFEYGDECRERFIQGLRGSDAQYSHKRIDSASSSISIMGNSHPLPYDSIKHQTDPKSLLKRISSARLVSANSWRGIVFRIWWMASIGIMAAVMTLVCFHGLTYGKKDNQGGIKVVTASQLGQRLLYTVIIYASLIIHGIYVLQGKNTTTVIPCIQSTWYRVFTIILFMGTLGCFTTSAFESMITACGKSTTYPPYYKMESNVCAFSK